MQNSLRARLCFFSACLMILPNVWANDIRPWGETKDYVQLESISSNTNQHPVDFSAEQLTRLLGQFYKREGNKEPAPYFSQDEIGRIAKKLVPLFAKAKPDEDIDFGISFSDSGLFLIPRKLNAGRLFVENGHLNLIIGMCAAMQDITYQQLYGKYKELDHGNRLQPVDKLGCELLASNITERVNNRSDWLRLNIDAALTTNVVPLFPSSKTLTFGTSEPTTQGIHTTPANKVEERLTVLKSLHDKGLVTDAEYQQKRAELLKGL
jgi:hypothetical protein